MQVRGCSSGARPFLKLYSYHPRSCRGCSGSSNIDVNGVATRIRIQDHCNQNSFICAAFINRSVMLYSKPISICFYSRLELYIFILLCWPVLVPQMTGVPGVPVMENWSVTQSPILPPWGTVAVAPKSLVPKKGPANTIVVKSNRIRQTDAAHGHKVYSQFRAVVVLLCSR